LDSRRSLHIVLSGIAAYNVMYSGGSARKARRFHGIDPVAKFLESDMGIKRDIIDDAVLKLNIEGHASIHNLPTPESDLRRFGLLG
jgi:hypothetical protein